MEYLIKLYYSIDPYYLLALLSIFVFHKLRIDKYFHRKIVSSFKILITLKVIGKVTWGIGVSIVGGIILPVMSLNVIGEPGFWLGVLFITFGVLMEEKSRKYLNLSKG